LLDAGRPHWESGTLADSEPRQRGFCDAIPEQDPASCLRCGDPRVWSEAAPPDQLRHPCHRHRPYFHHFSAELPCADRVVVLVNVYVIIPLDSERVLSNQSVVVRQI
jgi:hypothetical protein